uniref:testicular spindle-associated protein SHCBP1L-like n=1 Tax=Centroberyx gerrardi TaxID=166262 RepID=UPI003AAFACCF
MEKLQQEKKSSDYTQSATAQVRPCGTETLRLPPKAEELSEEEEGEEEEEEDEGEDDMESSPDASPQIVRKKIYSLRTKLFATLKPVGEDMGDSGKSAKALPPVFTSNKTYSYNDQASLFCDQVIGRGSAEEVDEALNLYVKEELDCTPSWTAVWKVALELLLDGSHSTVLPPVAVLVEVCSSPCEVKCVPLRLPVSLAEPFSCDMSDQFRGLVEEVLLENHSTVRVLDLYPVQGQGADVQRIAEALEQARFFYEYLWRGWDDVAPCEDYAGVIDRRLQMFYDIQDGIIPAPISQHYRETLKEYNSKREEFMRYQAGLCREAPPTEREYWRKFYKVKMLCDLLKFWEDPKLRVLGPSYPRIYKRRRGPRTSGRLVTHIVAQTGTVDKVDPLIQHHDSLSDALDACFPGDSVLLLPGEYQALGLAALTDDIAIRGVGEREAVVLLSDPSHHGFVASRASQALLSNLTLVQRETTDGIVVAEAGRTTLDGCVLKCDGIGVLVLTGATLVMKDCQISGAKGPGVELFPGSAAELYGNEIHHCSSQEAKGSQGAVSLKVLPKPRLRMSGNRIHDNKGYGVTVVVPDISLPVAEGEEESPATTAGGDRSEEDKLVWDLQQLSLELNGNTLHDNRLGDCGLLHGAGSSA